MAINTEEKSLNIRALEEMSARFLQEAATKKELKAVSDKVDTLQKAGGEPNTIESIKKNGTPVEIGDDKSVDIEVPTKVSELTNDEKFQKESEVKALIEKLRGEVMGEGVNEAYDTFAELAEYIESHKSVAEALQAAIGNKVDKEGDKVLSENDFTTALKERLEGIAENATKVEASTQQGYIKINGSEVQVVEFATSEEVKAALDKVFGTAED